MNFPDPSYVALTRAFRGEGMRPFSVAHPRASRLSGDLVMSWVRRTRLDGDSWESVEVPLGETSELYEIDILIGSTVVRTLASTTLTAAYSASAQIADFGAAQSAVSVRIYQLGSTFGRGSARSATL